LTLSPFADGDFVTVQGRFSGVRGARELDRGRHPSYRGWGPRRALGCHPGRSDSRTIEERHADVRRLVSGHLRGRFYARSVSKGPSRRFTEQSSCLRNVSHIGRFLACLTNERVTGTRRALRDGRKHHGGQPSAMMGTPIAIQRALTQPVGHRCSRKPLCRHKGSPVHSRQSRRRCGPLL